MRHRTLRSLTAVVTTLGLLLGLILGSASVASAKIVERERYSFTESFTEDVCDIDVWVTVEGSGLFMIRQDKQDSTAFFGSDNFQYREEITNLETGATMVIRGKGNFREIKATNIEGDIYLFKAQTAGQHFVIESGAGDVVYRERGLLVFEILFDTFGDDVPGGEVLSAELVALRGHPGFQEDLCPIVHDLIG